MAPRIAHCGVSKTTCVSHVAALVTAHFCRISLTYLNTLPTFSLTVLSFGIGSRNLAPDILNVHLPQHKYYWTYWWRNILKISGTWMEKENCQMHRQNSQDFFSTKGHLTDIQAYEETNNLSSWWCRARYVDAYVRCKRKRKQNKDGAIQKPKLENDRELRGIFFTEPNDEEFKLTMKAARRKLAVPMPAAVLCKITDEGEWRKPTAVLGNAGQNMLFVVDADESTTPKLEGAVHKHHEDHITAGGVNSITHYSFVHKFIPDASSIKNTRCKGSSGERKGKTGENSGMAADASQKQRGDRWSKDKGRKVHFSSLMDLCHLKNSELEPQYQKYRGRVVLRGDIVKGWFRFTWSVHWTRIISIPNGSRKSHGHYIKTTWMFRTSSRCNNHLHPGQNGTYTNVTQNSEVRMSGYLDTSTKAQMG